LKNGVRLQSRAAFSVTLAPAPASGAGVWAYAHWEDSPDGDSVVNAVRLAGVPVLDYFLGCGQ
jgi:hypothetical protein